MYIYKKFLNKNFRVLYCTAFTDYRNLQETFLLGNLFRNVLSVAIEPKISFLLVTYLSFFLKSCYRSKIMWYNKVNKLNNMCCLFISWQRINWISWNNNSISYSSDYSTYTLYISHWILFTIWKMLRNEWYMTRNNCYYFKYFQ